MDTQMFIDDYIHPSEAVLNEDFRVPLPQIDGLVKRSEFIVQAKTDTTFSTNLITTYVHAGAGVRLVEVYKNSQEETSGVFVRLVGTLAMLKKGYPCLFLDAAVSNVDPRTAQKEPLSARVAVHMPQADKGARSRLFKALTDKCAAAGFESGTAGIPVLPPFWGGLWHVKTAGADLDMIGQVRIWAWEAYQEYCAALPAAAGIDYADVQHQMILKNSVAEYGSFLRMGLAVPVEAQAAFFSVLVTGI